MSNRDKTLISFNELKQNSSVELNVDDKKLRPIVMFAQQVRLQQLIETNFYDYLLAQRTVIGTYTGITDQVMLTFIDDYLKPYLYAYSVLEFLESNQVNLANVGITEVSSTDSKNPDKDRVGKAITKAEKTANFWSNRVKKYICNDSNWPSFQQFYDVSYRQNFELDGNPVRRSGIYIPSDEVGQSNYHKYRL